MELAVLKSPSSTELIQYDPTQGLMVIAAAEAAERHWRQAKDHTQLFKAIEMKLCAQARYVVWRDGVVHHGGDHKSKSRLPICNLVLPNGDPGATQICRWRARFCKKTATGTIIDTEKLEHRIKAAQNKCLKTCEQDSTQQLGGSGHSEYFTPTRYVELARNVLCAIDLDRPPARTPSKPSARGNILPRPTVPCNARGGDVCS
jgi:hypothetical protein